MIHSKLFAYFFWKIPCIEKLFILENYLDGKITWIEHFLALKKILNEKKITLKICMHWKNISLKIIFIENLFTLKNYLHKKITNIEKSFALKKLLSLKKLFALEKKIIKKLLHIQNFTFKIIFSTWCKLMMKTFLFF
jgi:hypothetical protein